MNKDNIVSYAVIAIWTVASLVMINLVIKWQ